LRTRRGEVGEEREEERGVGLSSRSSPGAATAAERFRVLNQEHLVSAALDDHRIAAVRTRRVRSRYPRTVGKNARLGSHGDGPNSQVRELVTDMGAVGWGISWTPEEKTPDLVGRRVSELIDPATGVLLDEAMPFDFPLHDLAGAILGRPVHRILAESPAGAREDPTAFLCYDGAIYMDDLDPEEAPRGLPAVLANCRQDHELGYRAFKLKIGRGNRWVEPEAGLRRDIEVTRAVREAYPEAQILVDGNDGYTLEGFLRYLDAVSDCRLFWVEEPFRENREDLRRLRDFLGERSPGTLIADGESGVDVGLMLELAREGLVDVLLMDIAGLGFTRWRQLMPAVQETGARISPHTWGEPLKTHYAAQLGAGVGRCVCVEGIPAVIEGVDRSAYRFTDGLLHVPGQAPGFGLGLGAG
jgi:L-alanine-DL-glutamate epimerase-like enolase superfamily enzyme